jgi:signal transduction histidine kinase
MTKRSWTLRQRLDVTALIYVASLLCNVGLSALFILAFLKPALNHAGHALQCQRQLERIRGLVRQQRPLAEGDLALPMVSARYQESENEVSDLARELENAMTAPELRSLWEQISAGLRRKKDAVEARWSALAIGDGSQPGPSLETGPFVDLDRLLSHAISLFSSRRQANIVRATRIQWWVVGILLANTALGVAICLAGLWFVRRWVILPTTELRRGAGQLSRGDFAARVSIQSLDEMGALGREVNEMARQIAEMQSQLVERERRSAAGEMVVHLEENLSGPLNQIRELASDTCQDHQNSVEIADFERRIESTAERLGHWLRDLRKVVLPTEPHLQGVSAGAMLQDVRTVLRPLLDQSRVQVQASLDPRIDEVMVDRLQFEQAVIALVTNAVEASGPGQTVEIEVGPCEAEASAWQLAVTDKGTGMPPELLSKIFLPFFTTKPQGNGIGLGLVKAIIESHGGSLSVLSALDSGTRFCAILPCAPSRR